MTESGNTLSRFTPSLMPHDLLERLFVARERVLDAILARVEAAAGSAERNHTLLVGPRGSGKTHLLSLVYHRVNARREAGVPLQIAWLPEDPWTIVSYRHLLAAIVDRLQPSLDVEIPRSAQELESLLAQRSERSGPIVALVENFDQILAALENEGQQRLRHILQTDRSILLVATSTRLDRALSDHASPFYGFFTTTRLEPFDLDEAATMLTMIAKENDDDDLVAYLHTDEGRARLRTVMHLAGGQPRMWAALATALTVGGLDELIDLLLTRFDDLTPYYQEQLSRLSGQQRLVVAELAEADRPINVSELAERVEVDPRSLAKTMSDLVDRGWAVPTTSPVTALLDRRRTYYELAEPLARLSFQIKDSRGEPLRIVVDFLKHWFDPDDFGGSPAEGMAAHYLLLASQDQAHDPVVAVTRRLQRLPITRAPTVGLLGEIDDALAALQGGEPEPFICLPMPVRAALEDRLASRDPAAVRLDVHRTALREFGFTRHGDMERWIARAEDLVVASTTSGETVPRQLLLADWLGRAWRFDEAREVLASARGGLDRDDLNELTARANLAFAYWEAGHASEAIALEEGVLTERERILGPEHRDTLTAKANLAASYQQAGRTHDAIALKEDVLAARERLVGRDHADTLVARSNLATSYQYAGRTDDAIALKEAVLENSERILGRDDPDTLGARASLAASYQEAGRTAEAIELLEATQVECERILGPDHPSTLTARGILAISYQEAGRTSEAIKLGESVLSERMRVLGPDHPDTLTARLNLAGSYQEAGRTEEAIELEEALMRDTERILGTDHPGTLTARVNLAYSYQEAGRVEEAITLSQAVVRDGERMLGADHPSTLIAVNNLAYYYHRAGRTEEAISIAEAVLTARERVLGPRHPHTASARKNLDVYRAGRADDA